MNHQGRDDTEPIEIEVEAVESEGVESEGAEAEGAESEGEAGDAGSGSEEYRVRGEDLLSRVKELVREGNVRRITIRSDEGNTLIEIPLAIGVAGALLLPVWAAVGAVAALVANCTITVERQAD